MVVPNKVEDLWKHQGEDLWKMNDRTAATLSVEVAFGRIDRALVMEALRRIVVALGHD